MAYRAEWTAYYVGHGAMNYIEIQDDSGNVVEVIIIDAGSNEDNLYKAGSNHASTAVSNINSVNSKLNHYPTPISIVFCITHTDTDHYCYFEKIIKNVGTDRKSPDYRGA